MLDINSSQFLLSRRNCLFGISALQIPKWVLANQPPRRIAAVVVGQSNEQGAGLTPDPLVPLNAPLHDPISPNGGQRSWWPYVAISLREKNNTTLLLKNTAMGATSLCDSWVGRARVWKSGLNIVRGTYVIHGRDLYRSDMQVGRVATTIQEPVPRSIADMAIDPCSWVYIGPSSILPGLVTSLDNPLFDPNNFLVKTRNLLMSIPDVDEKWVFISIGQGDKTVRATEDNYSLAIKLTTDYFLQVGAKVFIGFTCYGLSRGLDEWYQSELLPGWRKALNQFSSNPNVAKGANLRETLGVLPLLNSEEIPGLTSEGLHLNNAGYREAAAAWVKAIANSGWISN